MEVLVLSLFAISLIGCIVLDLSILIALGIGFLLFFGYGLLKGFSFFAMFRMALDGINTVKSILITFLLIGMLTALWRGAGTVATIICYCSWMVRPSVYLLAAFWLNSIMSFLTGTSFGTVATMGVICMTMGSAMHIHPLLAGGAIISGIFFGDRCSPVSTSALLVSELTKTDIFRNIKKMLVYGAAPFVITSVIYGILGFLSDHSDGTIDVWALFSKAFSIHYVALLPALIILILSLLHIKVKAVMICSIITALFVCIFIQHISPASILSMVLTGYRSSVPEVASMLDGGGVVSMLRVSAIVCLSSSYSGMFAGTHMLDGLRSRIARLGKSVTPFAGIMGVSIITSMISCNQTLSIMLTRQLCDELEPDNGKMAIDLEDAPVVIAPLIPWSIAGAVPIATIGVSALSLFAACYLYLVPICHFIYDSILFRKR